MEFVVRIIVVKTFKGLGTELSMWEVADKC